MSTRSSKGEVNKTSLSFNIPDFLHIYTNESNIDWNLLKIYIEQKIGTGITVDVRKDFLFYNTRETQDLNFIAEQLVKTKVFDVSNPTREYDPFPVEIKHEMDLIKDPEKKVFGMLYDGFKLQTLFRGLISSGESNFKHLHLVFTNRSIGTWDRGDGRYHARTSVYGFPCIISSPGLVEAPAKPREFYILRKALVVSGMARELVEAELKDKFRDTFIDYEDERLTDIVKGYILQAFFYHTTFEPFCEDKNCRLFNAHWQEDMMHAQLTGKDFCDKHEGILEEIKTKMKK
ncbi:MAG: hypothetical protein JSW00_14310 [Thermoplasmata archaeon]|nr:MAG: hypothetical protein JSW00_14310 [Thermoplasmata archaeon]